MTWMLTIDGAPVYPRVDQEMLGHCGNIKKNMFITWLQNYQIITRKLTWCDAKQLFWFKLCFYFKENWSKKKTIHIVMFS